MDEFAPARAVTAVSALLSGAVALVCLLAPPAPPGVEGGLGVVDALPATLLALGTIVAVVLPIAVRARPEMPGRARALALLGAILGAAPAIAAAFLVGAADGAVLARGTGAALAVGAVAVTLASVQRIPAALLTLMTLLLAVGPPANRFVAIAIVGGSQLDATLSSIELPLRAAGHPAAPKPRELAPARLSDVRLQSPSGGRFRPGVPLALEITGVATTGGLVLAGAEPPFAAAPLQSGPAASRAELLFLPHNSAPQLGPALASATALFDWRSIAPAERLRLLVDPTRLGTATSQGPSIVTALPGSLGALLPFDDVAVASTVVLTPLERDRLAAFRALAAEQALATRAPDPSVDPDRYLAEAPPRLPDAARRALAFVAAVGSLAVVGASLIRGPHGTLVTAFLGATIGISAIALAPDGRLLTSERSILLLEAGASAGAEVREIEVFAPYSPIDSDFSLPPSFEALVPVLYRHPEPIAYAIIHDPLRGERTSGLTLGSGERRMFDAYRPLRLAGPLEARVERDGALRLVNRTGIDFSLSLLATRHGVAFLQPMEDGETRDVPADVELTSFSEARDALDAIHPGGRDLRRALFRLLEGRRAPEAGRLVLVSAPAATAFRGTDIDAAIDVRPMIVIVSLGTR